MHRRIHTWYCFLCRSIPCTAAGNRIPRIRSRICFIYVRISSGIVTRQSRRLFLRWNCYLVCLRPILVFIDIKICCPVSSLIFCNYRAAKLHILHISLHARHDLVYKPFFRKDRATLNLYDNLPVLPLYLFHKITGLVNQTNQILYCFMALFSDIVPIILHDLSAVLITPVNGSNSSILIIVYRNLRIHFQNQCPAALLYCHFIVRPDFSLLRLSCTSRHQNHT